MTISFLSIWSDMYTFKDSLQHVGQRIEPKSEKTVLEIVISNRNSGTFKNLGFPKGCKPYSEHKF